MVIRAEKMRFSFEVRADEIEPRIDEFIDVLIDSLESEFLVLPRGPGFVEYERFLVAYEVLRRKTGAFVRCDEVTLADAIEEDCLVLVVIRSILGFTPSEWAHLTSKKTGVRVDQGFARSLDRRVRDPSGPQGLSRTERVHALLLVASDLLARAVPEVGRDAVHRLDKADTRDGWKSVGTMAKMGAPYAMLLYERFLGRPFASHRDSVSELVGGGLEAAIERRLTDGLIPFRKTKRAERIQGFDQTPDFIVPDEFSPAVVIEAKLTEDDGTARDKVTRVQHLAQLSRERVAKQQRGFEVVAVIAGRGFAVRREDVRKLLVATSGKVYTLKTLDRLIETSGLAQFRPQNG